MVEAGFWAVWFAALGGIVTSFVIEGLLRPSPLPSWRRPLACTLIHLGSFLGLHAVLVLLVGRPWFAMAVVLTFLLLIVVVNNAKQISLREPFVYQDFEYFTDAILHPRLYLPFLGWGRTIAAGVVFCAAVAVGWWLEPVLAERLDWSGQLGGGASELILGAWLIGLGLWRLPTASFDAAQDLRRFGLLAALWRYAIDERQSLVVTSRFSHSRPGADDIALPHLVAVQSESFFDPRRLFSGIRVEVLAGFDELRREAAAHGGLLVPAWGANTVRSEFAFLSGISEAELGVHRFNPYRHAATTKVATLPRFLQQLGYRTVAIHPYPASFYRRSKVYPQLGFDEFIDLSEFRSDQRDGPYIGDMAVAEKIRAVLAVAKKPTFVFAVTMENHGPLHLERSEADEVIEFYDQPPPKGCEDLTVYLRHLKNADKMVVDLKQTLQACGRPASLCWFGDHVPIMSAVYKILGTPSGATEYVIWRSGECVGTVKQTQNSIHQLAERWLRCALIRPEPMFPP